MNSSPPPKHLAFTLIELLVVIVIIAVLAAMILSGIGKVRENATSAKCAANMKQIMGASFQFAADHNSQLPRLHYDNSPANNEGYIKTPLVTAEKIVNNPNVYFWPDLLALYAPNAPIFSCPKLKLPAVSGPGGGSSNRYPLGIGINWSSMAPNNRPPLDGPNYNWTRIINIPQPSKTVWFADSGGDVTGPWNTRKDLPGTGSCFFRGVEQDGNGVMPRHNGKANMAFADGHVALTDPSKIDYGTRDPAGAFLGYGYWPPQ